MFIVLGFMLRSPFMETGISAMLPFFGVGLVLKGLGFRN